MCVATAEDIAAFELLALELERTHAQRCAVDLERARDLLAIEQELASAVSVATVPSVACRDRDRPIVLAERAVVWDRTLVVDDAPRSGVDEPRLFGIPIGAGRQAEFQVSAR